MLPFALVAYGLSDPSLPLQFLQTPRQISNFASEEEAKAQRPPRRTLRVSQAEILEPEIERQAADRNKENADKGGGDTQRYPALWCLVGKDDLCHVAQANRSPKTAIE